MSENSANPDGIETVNYDYSDGYYKNPNPNRHEDFPLKTLNTVKVKTDTASDDDKRGDMRSRLLAKTDPALFAETISGKGILQKMTKPQVTFQKVTDETAELEDGVSSEEKLSDFLETFDITSLTDNSVADIYATCLKDDVLYSHINRKAMDNVGTLYRSLLNHQLEVNYQSKAQIFSLLHRIAYRLDISNKTKNIETIK